MATLADFARRPGVEFRAPCTDNVRRFAIVCGSVTLQRKESDGHWVSCKPYSVGWGYIVRDDFEEVCPEINADHYVVFMRDEDGREYAYKYDTKGQARLGAYAASMQDSIMEVSEPIPVIDK